MGVDRCRSKRACVSPETFTGVNKSIWVRKEKWVNVRRTKRPRWAGEGRKAWDPGCRARDWRSRGLASLLAQPRGAGAPPPGRLPSFALSPAAPRGRGRARVGEGRGEGDVTRSPGVRRGRARESSGIGGRATASRGRLRRRVSDPSVGAAAVSWPLSRLRLTECPDDAGATESAPVAGNPCAAAARTARRGRRRKPPPLQKKEVDGGRGGWGGGGRGGGGGGLVASWLPLCVSECCCTDGGGGREGRGGGWPARVTWGPLSPPPREWFRAEENYGTQGRGRDGGAPGPRGTRTRARGARVHKPAERPHGRGREWNARARREDPRRRRPSLSRPHDNGLRHKLTEGRTPERKT